MSFLSSGGFSENCLTLIYLWRAATEHSIECGVEGVDTVEGEWLWERCGICSADGFTKMLFGTPLAKIGSRRGPASMSGGRRRPIASLVRGPVPGAK